MTDLIGSERSPLRTISDMLAEMGCVRVSGNYQNGMWRYRLTFYSQERGHEAGEGSGETLGEAYSNAIANKRKA